MRDDVRRGDIFALGRHRLACIDATDKAAVARLFAGQKPTLVVTSPPYADARDYNDPITCWDSMMLGALDGHVFADDVQLLVNLGVIHRKGEWMPYWWRWAQEMRNQKWQHAGLYVWDKLAAIPGAPTGSPRPSHEFIFHFRKARKYLNLTEPCTTAGRKGYTSLRDANGQTRHKRHGKIASVGPRKVLDSVIRMPPEKNNRSGHPAVFPVSLPQKIIAAWATADCCVYDAFAGSGTLAHAAENEGADALMAEISPAYVQLAIDRWRRLHPDKPVMRLYSHAAA